MLRATRFRVQNFKSIDDSGWIPLDKVTAFVGRNESGKTSLMKALHKFNPATPEPYNPQREFPRDRYTREFRNAADWPVCAVTFEFDNATSQEIGTLLGDDNRPTEVTCTKFYDDRIEMVFSPSVLHKDLDPSECVTALKSLAAAARRLVAPASDQEDQTQTLRTELATWASSWQEKLSQITDLRNPEAVTLLTSLRQESDQRANPTTADVIENLQGVLDPTLLEARKKPLAEQVEILVRPRLPVFIYFDNYGILDSAIYLPRFLEDLKRHPDDPRIRTINAMFKHVNLTAQEISELGKEKAQQARQQGNNPTDEMIAQDQNQKEARAIKLNSGSLDITKRFNEWYGQRRHTIEYQGDGDYFRIWISDDRRPGVKIELESRSKGFQWFFSFYLVFLVESEEGHKDAILLLDEPALHLHPTAQQELISFFERLSDSNQLLYSTHSPFLIDGENIQRVRPVTEAANGHSHVSIGEWPKDRETIFPLQAAAGYAMVRSLFQHRQNVLVEGMTDYYYLYALSQQCRDSQRVHLSDDVYITPCGGTKLVGNFASLFLGQRVRPLILLDGDDAGRVRREALLKELYAGEDCAILMLDAVLDRAGDEVEIEDILGEAIILPALKSVVGKAIKLNESDRKAGGLVTQIKVAAKRLSIELPDGWKATIARDLVSDWTINRKSLPDAVLDSAAKVFVAIHAHFGPSKIGSPDSDRH
jgi:predicted ATP-dependent endonuclease of OLD family